MPRVNSVVGTINPWIILWFGTVKITIADWVRACAGLCGLRLLFPAAFSDDQVVQNEAVMCPIEIWGPSGDITAFLGWIWRN